MAVTQDTAAPAAAPDPQAILREAVLADPEAILSDPRIVQALLAAQAASAGAGARNVVDLRGALLDRLEGRLGRLEETHRSVVAAAYENLAGAQTIHRAAMAVLEAEDFDAVLAALQDDVPGIVAVDLIRLGLETEDETTLEAPLVALEPGFVDRCLSDPVEVPEDGPARVVALRPLAPISTEIWGRDAVWLGSEALVRLDLGQGARPGLLAFGSAEQSRFTPDQAGDLLEFFGAVVASATRRGRPG
ncbi:MAG: DUF484 family protein [Pseudomonadota bacterium]